MNVMMAAAVLHDRGMRRRALSGFLVLLLAMFALGLWVIDAWLAASVWRFIAWWGACALLACFIFLFAVVDAVAVVREERERFHQRLQGKAEHKRDACATGEVHQRLQGKARDSTCDDE